MRSKTRRFASWLTNFVTGWILIIVLGTCFRSASNLVRHEVSLIALRLCRIVFENNFLHRFFSIGDSPRSLFEMCEDYTWLRIARDLSSSATYVWILEEVINIRKKILFVPIARESAINSNRLKTRDVISCWEADRLQSIAVYYATMRLLLTITFAIALFFILSTSSTRTTDASVSGEEKRFLPFDSYKIEAGSIINVPVQCPPNTVKVGSRCRNVF